MDIIIRLSDCNFEAALEIKEDDGSVIEKTISLKDLKEAFQEKPASVYYRPAALFNDYSQIIEPGLLVGKKSFSVVSGIFFLPEGKRYMNFAGEKFLITFPSLAFYLKTLNGKIIESRLFALKEATFEKLSLKSILYAFPFGNVEPNEGKICWGSNRITELWDYGGLRTAIEIFFASESNMDYVHKGKNFKGYNTYRHFLDDLKEKERFPKKVLIESSCIHTLEELFKVIDKTEEI